MAWAQFDMLDKFSNVYSLSCMAVQVFEKSPSIARDMLGCDYSLHPNPIFDLDCELRACPKQPLAGRADAKITP